MGIAMDNESCISLWSVLTWNMLLPHLVKYIEKFTLRMCLHLFHMWLTELQTTIPIRD